MTKKAIPVSDDLTEYFADPCPVLSDNNSQLIFDCIGKGYDYVVEYGMGASTLYFLKAVLNQKTKFISVENNFDWFQICVQKVKRQTGFQEFLYTWRSWTLEEITRFVNGESQVDVPQQYKRFTHWRDRLGTGPFFRFSPLSKSRISGKLGFLWPVLKPTFQIFSKIYYLLYPGKRPQDGEWRGKHGEAELILRNAAPSIKDQFGEAPNMMDYIYAGLKDIKLDLEAGETVKAAFIIDGGPRHKVVEEILSLEEQHENFKPTIFLCEGSRIFYHQTLAKRPSGRFLSGTNFTLKGTLILPDVVGEHAKFWVGGDKTGLEQAQQEIWFYSRID